MKSGYLSLEFHQLKLGLKKAPAKELSIRVDAEISGGSGDAFTWASSGTSKFSGSTFKPLMEEEPVKNEEDEDVSMFITGFNDLNARTTYIDLNNEVMNSFANSVLTIKIMSINDSGDAAAAPPPKKGAKDAAPPPPAEEALVELRLPLSSVMAIKNCNLNVIESFGDLSGEDYYIKAAIMNDAVAGACSSLSFHVSADNELSEYVMGCRIFKWDCARLDAPPAAWGLKSPDVVDPKAKVQPTAADLRAKYLENVPKLVETQGKIVTYGMTIGSAPTIAAAGEESTGGANEGEEKDPHGDQEFFRQTFTPLVMRNGVVSFNVEAAAEVGEDENIREKGDLWSISWQESSVIFLHRSMIRKVKEAIQRAPHFANLSATITKTPTIEGKAVEGEELTASAQFNIEALLTPGRAFQEISGHFEDGSGARSNTTVNATIAVNAPIVPRSVNLAALGASQGGGENGGDLLMSPADVASAKQVVAIEHGKDAPSAEDILNDLRKELTNTVERLAQEYVTMYPNSVARSRSMSTFGKQTPKAGGGGTAVEPAGSGTAVTAEERVSEFVHFMATNGVFHELKESMKPKLQLIIREKYGTKGRAMGKSDALKTLDFAATAQGGEDSGTVAETMESILSDLYVFLLKECSVVMNSLFSDTIIDKDVELVDVNARIDDEKETNMQIFDRLLRQSYDSAADGRFENAESQHLERIQLINHDAAMGSKADLVHAVYARYGEFLLKQSAHLITASNASYSPSIGDDEAGMVAADRSKEVLLRAREALSLAVEAKPSEWRIALLYASLLVEFEQQEQAEQVLHKVIEVQLRGGNTYEMSSFTEFDGYESDKLCPIDPLCYAVLAALFSLQNQPLRARKALILADRSYVEDEIQPDISTHGSPRRTVVLILSDAAVHLFRYSLEKLGRQALKLALECEQATTEKAQARGMPCTTVPHIKYTLKLAQFHAALFPGGEGGDAGAAVNAATESQLVADTPVDKAIAWQAVGIANLLAKADISTVIESYLNAFECGSQLSLTDLQEQQYIPLETFVKASKLLANMGRFEDMLALLLFGCTIYSSASLFMLIGVACIRLDKLCDAEDALIEANLIDNRNADVWGYLCMVCLLTGPHRLEESTRALEQAMRLQLGSPALLRELAMAYMAVDKLQIAEDLIRRAIVADSASGSGRGNRKLLADVLAGQNKAASAIEEYQATIEDEQADLKTRIESAQKCAELLASLGRDEEVKTINKIISALSGPDTAVESADATAAQ